MNRIPLIFAIAWLVGSCAVLYSAKPTVGTVIDANTKEPVAGAVVVAEWILEGGLERGRVGTLRIFEVTTDRAGHFEISGWGPEPAPIVGVLDKFDPLVRVLKPGYVPKGAGNPPSYGAREARQDHSWLRGEQPIEITKFTGTPANYMAEWDGIYSLSYDTLNNGSRCEWKRIPKTIRILEDQEKEARAQGLRPMFHVSAKELMERKQCAPFDEFLRAYSDVNW